MKTIKEILMRRDMLSSKEADALILEASANFWDRLDHNEDPYNICEEYFGLEADYLDELMAL